MRHLLKQICIQRRYASTKQYLCRLPPGVYISNSHDIYANLALEDWIYENSDMQDKAMLLMWRNGPAIVIGRHQNTWAEVNIDSARAMNVPIVRRKSGGGTVYHDMGNLNISFFSSKKAYSRKPNLELLASVLRNNWNLNVEVTQRDDVILDDKYKISGTAAKLGVKAAYHHFTLLLNVDTTALHKLLRPDVNGILTKATSSVPAAVRNLRHVRDDVTSNDVMMHMAQEYATEFLQNPSIKPVFVDPLDQTQYPGVTDIMEQLQSWEWTYAKTPKFKVQRGFIEFVEGIGFLDVDICLEIDKGRIIDFNIESKSMSYVTEVLTHFRTKLCEQIYNLNELTSILTEDGNLFSGGQTFDLEKRWIRGLIIKHMIGNS